MPEESMMQEKLPHVPWRRTFRRTPAHLNLKESTKPDRNIGATPGIFLNLQAASEEIFPPRESVNINHAWLSITKIQKDAYN